MADSFPVNVVTPLGPVASADVDGVIAPGALGQFEVLGGHVPYLTELHAGVLRLGRTGDDVFAVSKGFLEVEPSGAVQVLAEKAVRAADVDVETVRTEAAELDGKVKAWKQDVDADYKNLVDRLSFARAQLDAAATLAS